MVIVKKFKLIKGQASRFTSDVSCIMDFKWNWLKTGLCKCGGYKDKDDSVDRILERSQDQDLAFQRIGSVVFRMVFFRGYCVRS